MKEVILKNKDDFYWYTVELDLKARYEHKHNGTPEKYPCKIESVYWDDPNGPYTYNHKFLYQIDEMCEHCGHKTKKWVEI